MRRAQATLELLALLGAALALTAVIAFAGDGWARHLVESIPGHRAERRDDRWALRTDAEIRRYVPTLVLERDRFGADASVPVDVGVCRAVWCAAYGTGRPAIFTHRVRRPGVTFVEYWFYYPDSRTLHAPLGALEGYHRDDWEGLVVRIPDGGPASARVTAHQWLVGAGRGWLGDPGWRPVDPHPVIYRAAGSHANGFSPDGIDVPLDTWNGTLATLPPSAFQLIAADTAPALRFRYDPAAVPPWRKALWINPEAEGTGTPQPRTCGVRPCPDGDR